MRKKSMLFERTAISKRPDLTILNDLKELQEYFSFTAPQSIYKWQRGETLPDITNLLALAKLFNCTIEEILVYSD